LAALGFTGEHPMLAKPSWWLENKIRPVVEKFEANPMSEDMAGAHKGAAEGMAAHLPAPRCPL
jgi:hypothetical protein